MATEPGSYVSGVPVRISERFRPPRKVKLPASCPHSVDQNILSEEYDVTMETAALSWIEDYHQRKEQEASLRQTKILEFRAKLAAEKAAKEEEERRKKEELEEKLRQERLEEERLELEKERLELERLQREKLEKEQQQKERLEKERIEKEEADKAAQIRMEELNMAKLKKDISEGSSCTIMEEPSIDTCPQPVDDESSDSLKEMEELKLEFSGIDVTTCQAKTPSTVESSQGTSAVHSSAPSTAVETPACPNQFSVPVTNNITTTIISSNSASSNRKDNNYSAGLSLIDLSDFEPQNDPFDKAVLQSINDMEVLAQVLQPQVVSNAPCVQSNCYYPQPQVSSYGNSLVTNYPNLTQGTSQSVASTSNNSSSSNSIYPQYHNVYHQQHTWNAASINGVAKQPSSEQPHMLYSNMNYSYPYPMNVTSSYSMTSGTNSSNTYSSMANGITTGNVGDKNTQDAASSGPSQRPDLEHFYSKYYGGGQQLSSSKSVPDLTAPEDQEVSKISDKVKASLSNGSPRPSSTGPAVSRSRPPTTTPIPSRPSSTGPHSSSSPPPTQGVISHCLPDPYDELDVEAQAVVNSVAEMGFPRDRVSRAVMKLGTKHKKLIEVLLELQGLEESGEESSKAEIAFYAYLGDTDKTKEHLDNTRQLVALGFDEETITKLLLKHNNDRDKTLEELIS